MEWSNWLRPERPPKMPTWYWALFCTPAAVLTVLYIGGWHHRYQFLIPLCLAVFCLITAPLLYKKAMARGQHRRAIIAVVCEVAIAAVMLWAVVTWPR